MADPQRGPGQAGRFGKIIFIILAIAATVWLVGELTNTGSKVATSATSAK